MTHSWGFMLVFRKPLQIPAATATSDHLGIPGAKLPRSDPPHGPASEGGTMVVLRIGEPIKWKIPQIIALLIGTMRLNRGMAVPNSQTKAFFQGHPKPR